MNATTTVDVTEGALNIKAHDNLNIEIPETPPGHMAVQMLESPTSPTSIQTNTIPSLMTESSPGSQSRAMVSRMVVMLQLGYAIFSAERDKASLLVRSRVRTQRAVMVDFASTLLHVDADTMAAKYHALVDRVSMTLSPTARLVRADEIRSLADQQAINRATFARLDTSMGPTLHAIGRLLSFLDGLTPAPPPDPPYPESTQTVLRDVVTATMGYLEELQRRQTVTAEPGLLQSALATIDGGQLTEAGVRAIRGHVAMVVTGSGGGSDEEEGDAFDDAVSLASSVDDVTVPVTTGRNLLRVISDTHLGSPWHTKPDAAALCRVLDDMVDPGTAVATLVIAGDLLEMWLVDSTVRPPDTTTLLAMPDVKAVIDKIVAITVNGVAVHYIKGNHDDLIDLVVLDAAFQGRVHLYTAPEELVLHGIRFMHGHEFDFACQPYPKATHGRPLAYYLSRGATHSHIEADGAQSSVKAVSALLPNRLVGVGMRLVARPAAALAVRQMLAVSFAAPWGSVREEMIVMEDGTEHAVGDIERDYRAILADYCTSHGVVRAAAFVRASISGSYGHWLRRSPYLVEVFGHTHMAQIRSYRRHAGREGAGLPGKVMYCNTGGVCGGSASFIDILLLPCCPPGDLGLPNHIVRSATGPDGVLRLPYEMRLHKWNSTRGDFYMSVAKRVQYPFSRTRARSYHGHKHRTKARPHIVTGPSGRVGVPVVGHVPPTADNGYRVSRGWTAPVTLAGLG